MHIPVRLGTSRFACCRCSPCYGIYTPCAAQQFCLTRVNHDQTLHWATLKCLSRSFPNTLELYYVCAFPGVDCVSCISAHHRRNIDNSNVMIINDCSVCIHVLPPLDLFSCVCLPSRIRSLGCVLYEMCALQVAFKATVRDPVKKKYPTTSCIQPVSTHSESFNHPSSNSAGTCSLGE